jgi:hypothetical protein
MLLTVLARNSVQASHAVFQSPAVNFLQIKTSRLSVSQVSAGSGNSQTRASGRSLARWRSNPTRSRPDHNVALTRFEEELTILANLGEQAAAPGKRRVPRHHRYQIYRAATVPVSRHLRPRLRTEPAREPT